MFSMPAGGKKKIKINNLQFKVKALWKLIFPLLLENQAHGEHSLLVKHIGLEKKIKLTTFTNMSVLIMWSKVLNIPNSHIYYLNDLSVKQHPML